MEIGWIIGGIWVIVGLLSALVDLIRARKRGYFEFLIIVFLNLILGPLFVINRILFDRLPYALGWGFGYLAGRTSEGFKDGKDAGSDQ